jgi:hypothetical protein
LNGCFVAALLLQYCCLLRENSNTTASWQQYNSNKPPVQRGVTEPEKDENKYYRGSVCTLILRAHSTASLRRNVFQPPKPGVGGSEGRNYFSNEGRKTQVEAK